MQKKNRPLVFMQLIGIIQVGTVCPADTFDGNVLPIITSQTRTGVYGEGFNTDHFTWAL